MKIRVLGGKRMFGLTDQEKAALMGKLNQKMADVLDEYGSITGSGKKRRHRKRRHGRKPYLRR